MNVGLFIPCYVDQFYPNVAIASLQLLKKLGFSVHYPMEQTCCGQPMANAGFEEKSIPVYKHFIETFREFDYVVAPSGSCVYHVRKHYDVLPQEEAVVHIRHNTLDLTEFLLNVAKIDDLGAYFPHRVGLHQSCHGLRGLELGKGSERVVNRPSKVQQLLNKVEGLELVELEREDECCGFGGTFAVQEETISVKMGKDRIADHMHAKAEFITAGDMSCLMHLEGIIRRQQASIKVIHLAEILNSTH